GGLASTRALFDAAIGAEQDSIDFYENLLPALAKAHHEKVRRIIQEERRHLEDLKLRRDRHSEA
ncbi:MAG TPA: hypothetical protein PKE04_01025, partial [Clostridia bacterium]|nr:hypothetical protein [Clostridia bacterium]